MRRNSIRKARWYQLKSANKGVSASCSRQKKRQENSTATNYLSKRVKRHTNSCGAASTPTVAVPAMEDLQCLWCTGAR